MKITLDYENCTELPWTLVAENLNGTIIAAVCDSNLDNAQLKINLLLVELGHNIYKSTVDDTGFTIY